MKYTMPEQNILRTMMWVYVCVCVLSVCVLTTFMIKILRIDEVLYSEERIKHGLRSNPPWGSQMLDFTGGVKDEISIKETVDEVYAS